MKQLEKKPSKKQLEREARAAESSRRKPQESDEAVRVSSDASDLDFVRGNAKPLNSRGDGDDDGSFDDDSDMDSTVDDDTIDRPDGGHLSKADKVCACVWVVVVFDGV